jgi:hypothetical protein
LILIIRGQQLGPRPIIWPISITPSRTASSASVRHGRGSNPSWVGYAATGGSECTTSDDALRAGRQIQNDETDAAAGLGSWCAVSLPAQDTQQVEVVGRAYLTAALTRDGIEVARPERDSGIDLIAFLREPWRATPIQLKAFSKPGFSHLPKYETQSELRMVYAWLDQPQPTFYVLTWAQADEVVDAGNYKRDAGGRWITSNASAALRQQLAPFRVNPGSWASALGLATAG